MVSQILILASLELSKGEITTPLNACFMMLISRVSIVFQNRYWMIQHSFVLLSISLILITFWVFRFWHVPDLNSMIKTKYEMYVKKINK